MLHVNNIHFLIMILTNVVYIFFSCICFLPDGGPIRAKTCRDGGSDDDDNDDSMQK